MLIPRVSTAAAGAMVIWWERDGEEVVIIVKISNVIVYTYCITAVLTRT